MLEQFKTISSTNWKPRGDMLMQQFLAEAAANLVLGDRAKAMQCLEAEVERTNNAPRLKRQFGKPSDRWNCKNGQLNGVW